eukprot:CAMPEP_0170251288 /NCGR_PEP_ID=MMETSP0116_2-20130129/25473_1 /TAXON_ID=400756 /ORGANISM="Durinskia baltica, Strain CSIRO CS-38" /LENGTH=264 /DNA_ID=CAMNT_0010502249 /DNA_START=77 /DNA_END=868 /DNA_ORIENTATION=-
MSAGMIQVQAASPVVMSGGSAAAPIPAGASACVPQYVYPGGSVEVPVYGQTVSVQRLYQRAGEGLVTTAQPIAYTSSGFTQEQLKMIFPLGAPESFLQNVAPSPAPMTSMSGASAAVPLAGGSAAVPLISSVIRSSPQGSPASAAVPVTSAAGFITSVGGASAAVPVGSPVRVGGFSAAVPVGSPVAMASPASAAVPVTSTPAVVLSAQAAPGAVGSATSSVAGAAGAAAAAAAVPAAASQKSGKKEKKDKKGKKKAAGKKSRR